MSDSRFDSNGNKIHLSTSTAGGRIIFLASSMVSPGSDPQSKSLVRVARSATITCADCKQDFNATAFDGNALCPSCFDDAGMENEHNDGYHDEPNADCKLCRVCLGHEPGPNDPMGETVFCDGSCR